ncbi:MAG: preprotein translocase subunit SecF [Colwellia polaris]|jgi:preprotein translocase subunit SecF
MNLDINPKDQFDRIYEDYDRYFAVPVALILLSLLVIGGSFLANGQVFEKGTDFTGGTEVLFTINDSSTPEQVEQAFVNAEGYDWQPNDVDVRVQSNADNQVAITLPPPNLESETQVKQILDQAGIQGQVQELIALSGLIGAEFLFQAQIAFVLAFMIMSLVIFTAFRDFIPAAAVVFAASGDILIAAAGMVAFNIPLTLGSVAALLMLIGYSVDTDIVMSLRVLKQRRGKVREKLWSATKTGITMSSGGIAGFTLLYLASMSIVGPTELSRISSVVVIGLMADIPLTYFGNGVILSKYVNGDFEDIGGKIPWI